LSSEDIHALTQTRKVFWTLHDTWAFTGGCHYEQGCKKFESECNACPQAKKIFSKKISKNKLNKNKYFQENKNLIIITPSAWLKSMAIKSNTFYEPNIYHIPNGIDHTVFKPISNSKQANNNEVTLGLCAVDLLDRRKNIHRTLKWLKEIANKNTRFKILLQGKNAETFKGSSQYFRVEARNYDRNEMPIFYNELDYFVNFSLAENLPTTVLEAQACGIPVIVNSVGGSSEMIEVGRNGFIANDLDQLRYVLDHQSGRDDIRSFKKNSRALSLEKYDIHLVAEKYIDLYVTYN
jgi:glycosyltransferase involved in cell wall biosynthesis